MTTHPLNGDRPERHAITTVGELLDVLRGTFLVDIPNTEVIANGLQRLFGASDVRERQVADGS